MKEKEELEKAMQEYMDELISRLPEEFKAEVKRAVAEAISKETTEEGKTDARAEAIEQFAKENPQIVEETISQLDEESTQSQIDERTSLEEEAIAEYTQQSTPEVPTDNLDAIFAQVQAGTEEMSPVDEMQAESAQTMAALEEATKEEGDLKAPTDKEVPKTKPVTVEKAKKEVLGLVEAFINS